MIGKSPGITVLEGLPGSGKTQLAVQWTLSTTEQSNTHWVNATGCTSDQDFLDLIVEIERLDEATPLRVVIDNVMVPLTGAVHRSAALLLRKHPEMQLLICTRWHITQASDDDWRGINTAVIRQDQLCATQEENRQFVTHIRQHANDPVADILWREFRGWFLPTKIALETGGREGVIQTHQFLFRELLPSVAPAWLISMFLLVQHLGGLTLELLTKLIEEHRLLSKAAKGSSAAEVITALIEHGLVTRGSLSHPVPLWVVSPCLAQTARMQRYTSKDSQRLSAIALEFWSQQDESPAVTALLLSNARHAEAWRTLNAMRSQNGSRLFQDHPLVAIESLYGPPDSIAQNYPQLWALGRLTTSVVDGSRVNQIPAAPRNSPHAGVWVSPHNRSSDIEPSVLLLKATEHIIDLLRAGLADAALTAAQTANARFRSLSRALTTRDRRMFLAWFELHWAISEIHNMNKEQGLKLLRRAQQHAMQSEFDLVTASTSSRLALHCVFVGHTREARELIDDIRRVTSRLPFTLREIELEDAIMNAALSIDELSSEAALQHLARATAIGEAYESWPLLTFAKTQHTLYFGSPRVMLDELQRLSSKVTHQIENNDRGHSIVARCTADLYLSLGEIHRARDVVDNIPEGHPILLVSRARLALITGDYRGALALASRGRWEQTVTRRDRLELTIIEADAAERLGDFDAARASYLQALEVSMDNNVHSSFLALSEERLRTLDALLNNQDHRRHARPNGAREQVYPDPLPQVVLTPRELIVLQALNEGLPIAQIATQLSVSRNTVKKQTVSLYKKLGVHSRAEAILEANRLGIALS